MNQGKKENVNLFPALYIKPRINLSSFSAEYEKSYPDIKIWRTISCQRVSGESGSI